MYAYEWDASTGGIVLTPKAFLHHFNVGNNAILSAGEFCGKDGTMKFEELSNRIENNTENIFLVHISAYLKIYGENVLKNTLRV